MFVTINLFCEKHLPKENSPDTKEAIFHVMTDALFNSEEFQTFALKCAMTDDQDFVRLWNERHPNICCFFGDEVLDELMKVELPKVLLFGTKAVPMEG